MRALGLCSRRRSIALGTQFDPSHVGGLILWLDSDLGITQNGANVSAWADLSPTGANLVQATGTNQPKYNTNAVNGHASIQPNDAGDFVADAAKPDLRSLAGVTFFTVAKFTATAATTRLNFFWSDIATNNLLRFTVDGASTFGTIPFTDTTAFHVFEMLFDGTQGTNATKMKVFLDGAAQTLTFTGTIPTTTNSGAFNLGISIGASTNSLTGHISNDIIYNRTLAAAERTQVGKYLGARYGITTTY